ncbi:RCC1 domain-containing protein [Pseudogemmatithrix spongiicola]|uniref:RCC1 domain-containing protein n=1 Tax=Pseudogemmatithrix spongiicola TaxID=3062599 RepID=UPI0034676CBA
MPGRAPSRVGPSYSSQEPLVLDAPAGLRFRAVATGEHHGCAVSTSDDVWCWGRAWEGQLGSRVLVDSSPAPKQIIGLGAVQRLVAGRSHSCALDTEGRVWCWGRNHYRQLATGDTLPRSAPTIALVDSAFVDLVASPSGACGVTAGGAYHCWGATPALRSETPTPLPALEPLRQLAISDSHLCALTVSQTVYCQGENRYGVIGAGGAVRLDARQEVPFILSFPEPIASVSVGPISSCAVSTAGQAYCWGFTGSSGLLGIPADTLCRVRAPGSGCVRGPRPVRTDLRFQEIVIGLGESWRCGLTTDDRLACWGQGSIDVEDPPRSEPTIIPWPATP